MPKIQPSLVLRDFDGHPLKEPLPPNQIKEGGENSRDLTVASVIYQSMFAVYQGDENTTPEQKAQRYSLGQKFYRARTSGDEVEVTNEEAIAIKQWVNKGWNVLVCGHLAEILNGNVPECCVPPPRPVS
jgi:hypothetical protein